MARLEIACFSLESALLAIEADADRIELCDNQEVGGTTPPREWLTRLKAHATVDVPIFVMIRPRGGNFQYTDAEFETMRAEVASFKTEADGLVFGILRHDGTVDVQRTRELVEMAHPLPCTFHRAFDETPDPCAALEDVISAGCRGILSSGGAPNALAGVAVLETLVRRARDRIVVMPGGGVRLRNLSRIREATGAAMFHSSVIVEGAQLPDVAELREMKRVLRGDILAVPQPPISGLTRA